MILKVLLGSKISLHHVKLISLTPLLFYSSSSQVAKCKGQRRLSQSILLRSICSEIELCWWKAPGREECLFSVWCSPWWGSFEKCRQGACTLALREFTGHLLLPGLAPSPIQIIPASEWNSYSNKYLVNLLIWRRCLVRLAHSSNCH